MRTDQGTFRAIEAIEPLLPEGDCPELAKLSRDIFLAAGALSSALPAKATRQAVAVLVREMNSYYSNLIEGHKTLPKDIERALRSDFASDERERRNQHLAAAHIRAEEEMEQTLREEPQLDIHSAEFLCRLHRSFHEKLPDEYLYAQTTSGGRYRIEPGELRSFNVDVGAHTPPDYGNVRGCLDRFADAYGNRNILATDGLVAAAAAHHRLLWIHPFGDGNGRVARLYSHAALIRQQVDGLGLWTLSRGLARFRSRYYSRLSAADAPRRHDYDGRGSLSAEGLKGFCVFFLETALDQIRFMENLLDLPRLLSRIERYLLHESPETGRHKERLARLLSAVAAEGGIPRGRVPEIVGLKASAARQVTRLGLDEGFLRTPSPRGPLYIVFPAKALDDCFPRLFLDLPY